MENTNTNTTTVTLSLVQPFKNMAGEPFITPEGAEVSLRDVVRGTLLAMHPEAPSDGLTVFDLSFTALDEDSIEFPIRLLPTFINILYGSLSVEGFGQVVKALALEEYVSKC